MPISLRVIALLMLASATLAIDARAQSADRNGERFRLPLPVASRLFALTPQNGETVFDRQPVRERAANRACRGCEARPGSMHVVFDSPLLSDGWLDRHTYGSGGDQFGDNRAVADFWYDAVHRRILTRSASFHEVDDPADVRLGRAPGTYPNSPDFNSLLGEGTTVGQVGFEGWSKSGYGAYFAAVQGVIRDEGTGYLDLATVTGQSGRTRTGSRYDDEDLIKHVRLHPSGQLEVGFETNPSATPDPLLLVRGNQNVDGALTVTGAGGNVPHACSVRQFMTIGRDRTAAAVCSAGEVGIAGGGSCSSGNLTESRPGQTRSGFDGWKISCSKDGKHTAYVVCCAQ
jgi:hypothetical protein